MKRPALQVSITRADQSTGGALLEFPMRTAMHGKSRVSSSISVSNNLKNLEIGFSTVAVRARVEIYTNYFSAVIFISVLLMDFSDIVQKAK